MLITIKTPYSLGVFMLRHPFPVAIVVGIPGVGKTTLIDLSTKMLREKGYRALVLNYGDYMLKRLV